MYTNFAQIKRMNSINKDLTFFADKELKDYLSATKEKNKMLSSHTEFCYEYHNYFLLNECQKVKIYFEDTTKEVEKITEDTRVYIDLKSQDPITISHFSENKFPPVWGLIIENLQLLQGEKINFYVNFNNLFKKVLPNSIYQLSIHWNGDFKIKLNDENVKYLWYYI